MGANCNRRFILKKETLLHCESDRSLAQVGQRGFRVSILGDIQKPSGHGSGQPALSETA